MPATRLTKDQIAEKVKQILADQLNVPTEEILPASKIQGDLGADSLDVMEVVLSLEQEFEIEIPDPDVKALETFQGVVDYVDRRLNKP